MKYFDDDIFEGMLVTDTCCTWEVGNIKENTCTLRLLNSKELQDSTIDSIVFKLNDKKDWNWTSTTPPKKKEYDIF